MFPAGEQRKPNVLRGLTEWSEYVYNKEIQPVVIESGA